MIADADIPSIILLSCCICSIKLSNSSSTFLREEDGGPAGSLLLVNHSRFSYSTVIVPFMPGWMVQ